MPQRPDSDHSPKKPPRPSRRRLLRIAAAMPIFAGHWLTGLFSKSAIAAPVTGARVRPGDPSWPTESRWRQLGEQVGGALIRVRSPLVECLNAASGAACTQLFKAVKNPYFIGEEVALTQTLGWVDAWTTAPSVYAVAARSTAHVVAAVNFAREHNLRLVVKGGGHSYQGTSNAPDSLLIWTRKMNDIMLHDSFVAAGCEATAKPMQAVTIGAGALWGHVYDAVTTRAGGYVQGGGCMTVGVAGLVQSGGFGSFSKAYGLAASSLLQAEVVTADGVIRVVNACTHPDLFWALKGGGGGSFGVVTSLTLRVHRLPLNFGAVNMTIQATSPAAYRQLIGHVLDFYSEKLMNPNWGEQIRFRPNNILSISMVFQGLDRSQAQAIWRPFMDLVESAPDDFKVELPFLPIVATSARDFWAPTLIKRMLGFISTDDRPGAPASNVFWPGDQRQSGQVLHGYQSAWLPAALLQDGQRKALCDALHSATRHWGVSLHVNKGLAGASADAVAAAKDTAMNPAVLDAFALAISGAEEQPAFPGVPGHEPNTTLARTRAQAVGRAMDEVRKLVPNAGSYVAESDYFNTGWQQSFWGLNYPRLASVKAKYDPTGLFFVHHGVGSESWGRDGFTKQA
ncbi:FAD-dependent oxidoreductase [Hydrogenophaga sp.]|uniref:FAD-dependent oxidoreductase n=1 Tax=Hydrogenophaga sp. TaxID=1904254 RepID=UPI0025B9C092|nr:FAD-dependent oxidoreductase [Hydrogenophaga sp.]MBT9465595.1 FAD-binding protein [Hydrogenophaga sp.]